ncbi:MAG: TetR family transcriptional regulator [Solirubrobacteraceae bacterium]|nr:TetR family transcriptional regulator [Solirubrobacteraceae bacterium]
MTPDGTPTPRRPRRRPGRPPSLDRTAALDATWRVIANRGLDRTRYQDIAEESGVAVSTLQHTFGRLDEILAAGLRRAEELDTAFLDDLPTGDDATAWERITAFVLGTLAVPLPSGPAVETNMASWLVWVERWRAAARENDAAERLQATYDRWWATVEQIITDGQRDGSFSSELPAREIAIAINAVLDGVATNILLRHGGGKLPDAQRVALLATQRLLGVDANGTRVEPAAP